MMISNDFTFLSNMFIYFKIECGTARYMEKILQNLKTYLQGAHILIQISVVAEGQGGYSDKVKNICTQRNIKQSLCGCT